MVTAFEKVTWKNYILMPWDFTWVDYATLLAHQGAVILRDEGEHGRVIGYTKLCTDVLRVDWRTPPPDAGVVVSCFACLAACER